MVWPALPPPMDAQFFALLWQLERTQWWALERLRAYQLLQLSSLIKHAAQYAPAYKNRLKHLAQPAG